MTDLGHIINLLPYKKPFLFVDKLEDATEDGTIGTYQLKKDEYFYEGHFPGNPITPGVIIVEIMAQIGLVCYGLYLESEKGMLNSNLMPLFSSSSVDFLKPSFPGDVLKVISKKIYYRFGKLKCAVECHNLTTGEVVCKGEFSGMIVKKENIETD